MKLIVAFLLLAFVFTLITSTEAQGDRDGFPVEREKKDEREDPLKKCREWFFYETLKSNL